MRHLIPAPCSLRCDSRDIPTTFARNTDVIECLCEGSQPLPPSQLSKDGIGLHDAFAYRDVDGRPFLRMFPFTSQADARDRVADGLPVPAFSCWTGVAAMPAQPFARGARFTVGLAFDSCGAPDAEQIVMDMVAMGYKRVLVDPSVR